MDIRHSERIKIVQDLYAYMFFPKNPLPCVEVQERVMKIIQSIDEINEQIKLYAPKFPLSKVAKVDLAILQLAVYELTVEKKEPPKVVIDEAVELAKEMGSERSYAFINAVLGKIYQKYYAK